MTSKFDADLAPCEANYQPLTPIQFLVRAVDVYPDRVAVIYGEQRRTWREHAQRCHRLAGALAKAGIGRGDTVAIMAPNTPPMLEAQFGVPMAGAVLNCVNIRLDAPAVTFILQHSEARVLIVDRQFAAVARDAVAKLDQALLVIDIDDPAADDNGRAGSVDYEQFLLEGSPDAAIAWPQSEWDAIALNYTSGTTGNPKGVVYHHRGSYLNALGQLVTAELTGRVPVYLWTLPLFHCNGWCYAWAMAAIGGTQVCLRKVAAEPVYEAIRRHGVTHFCCAPTVLAFLIDGVPSDWQRPKAPIRVLSGGSSPPATVLRRLDELGFSVLHVYGMTEMHGVATLCQWQDEWDALPSNERLQHLARQGVRTVVQNEMMVADSCTLDPVRRDGKTMGEILLRGNLTMKGYLKNEKATAEAFAGGWYRTGDLAVVYENGYIEIKDRSKDIIISGGENVSSVEIEDVIYEHPAVHAVAVVAVPHERWGEVPCALIEIKPSVADSVTEEELIRFCRARLPSFKTPRHVIFTTLQRTATGKLQKFKLRAFATEHLAAAAAPFNT